ncbi:Tetraacyldisaccharide 4'-kinase [BD1-7 clade bacterium]|uniref:Tetraacyldisaccharide 4'-kinase n=1 Tax=BD1-7 clade bacterium TaxID=2029982 RepID=A0A5S9NN31_9GAMM|nr:Tetraacyldisaccharide 4'-kinase [BD1-7 clade bacterium]CAA0094305.1 Tetraacyldisaccharide 4'-kinase [BD1-7 clade bacterium]
MQTWVEKLWYGRPLWAPLLHPILLPLSQLFGRIAANRRRKLEAKQTRLSVPVIVVGNISVGGTGKTPFTIALVSRLQEQGIRVGVISRGYGGKAEYPYTLTATSTAEQSGDEPLMIFRRCGCPVVIDPDRVNAAQTLIDQHKVQIIISDDGLQHYRLPRDIEIAVVDGERGLGNGRCLPAGPLRESPKRLDDVDYVIINGENQHHIATANGHELNLAPGALIPIGTTPKAPAPMAQTVDAIAAIGNPQRFFNTLQTAGFDVEPHPFPDHYHYQLDDLFLNTKRPVLMTEKDAVKCAEFSELDHHWYLPVNAELSDDFWQRLEAHVQILLTA